MEGGAQDGKGLDMSFTPNPSDIRVPDGVLEDIRARIAAYPWHEMPDDGGWDYGTNLDYMRELCAWWLERFDWRAQEEAPQPLRALQGAGGRHRPPLRS